MRKILVLNSKEMRLEEHDIKGVEVSYETLYSHIGNYIEHLSGYSRELDERKISMWCDEEFRLRDDWEHDVSLIMKRGNRVIEVLAGNIVFTKDGDEGETFYLEDEDIKFIKNKLEIHVAGIKGIPKQVFIMEV